jgi:hypothetical protein
MKRNYTKERNERAGDLAQLNQQLSLISERVRAAATVAAKQEIFLERDRLLEQIAQLQMQQALADRDEMAELSERVEQPRFQPAAPPRR